MVKQPQILITTNPTYGFYGSSVDLIRNIEDQNGTNATEEYLVAGANARWNEASDAIMDLGYNPLVTQRLLDQRWGRYLSDYTESVPVDQLRQTVRLYVSRLKGRAEEAFDDALTCACNDADWE